MRYLNVGIIIFLLCASLLGTGMFSDNTARETSRLEALYRNDRALLSQELANCARWRAASQNMGGTCDGAFRGYATMSTGPSCAAAEAVGRELGVFISGPVVLLPVKASSD